MEAIILCIEARSMVIGSCLDIYLFDGIYECRAIRCILLVTRICALQPGITYLSLAIVGVRFLGLVALYAAILNGIHHIEWRFKGCMDYVFGFIPI